MSLDKNNFKDSLYFKRIKEFLNSSKLHKLLSENNIKLKFTKHHNLDTKGLNIELDKNIEFIPPDNISKHIGKTSLFVTDYSSIVFDFMFLDIPIVFYRHDFDDDTLNLKDTNSAIYAKSKDKYLYNCTYNLDDALKKIKHYIECGFELEEEYKKINAKFSYSKNSIRKNLIEQLEKLPQKNMLLLDKAQELKPRQSRAPQLVKTEKIFNEQRHLEYLKKINFGTNLNKTIHKLNGKKVVIYGAGEVFQTINKHYDLSKLNIIAVSDKKFENNTVEDFLGFKTCEPAEITKLNPDCVLLSTLLTVRLKDILVKKYFNTTKIKIKPLIKKPFIETLQEIWSE